MLIRVNQQDIHNGLQQDPCSCPIAIAVNRTLGQDYETYVGLKRIAIIHKKLTVEESDLPDCATKFVNDFDLGRKVQPFDFIVNFRKEGTYA